MDADTLERLLMDRALAALPSDTAALLEAYLATDAGAGKEAAQLSAIVQRAACSLATESPALPAFDRRRVLRAAERSHRVRVMRFAAAGLGMAACVALGMMLGRVGGTAPSKESSVSMTVHTEAPAARPAAGVEDFWSEARLRAVAALPHPAQKPYSIGNVPILNAFQLQGDQP